MHMVECPEAPAHLQIAGKSKHVEGILVGPCVDQEFQLMFPLGDGIVVVDYEGNGGFLRVRAGQVEMVCNLPLHVKDWVPESFRYESATSFWATTKIWKNGYLQTTNLFELVANTHDGTDVITITEELEGVLVAKDRIGGMWFYHGTNMWGKPATLVILAPVTKKKKGLLLHDAVETSYGCIQISENLAVAGDRVEMWYVAKCGLRSIFYNSTEPEGVLHLGITWYFKGVSNNALQSHPSICHPHHPKWKWLLHMFDDLRRNYWLACHSVHSIDLFL